MRAMEHTERMLQWWRAVGITRADLAVRRPSGTWAWHRALPPEALPLSWARAENAHGADVYIRPARGHDWPLLFLDDLVQDMAIRIANRYRALAIRTSVAGGCHLWLACAQPLAEHDRHRLQSWLARRAGADPRSSSGEHLGRLAGFRNHKRGGEWVNVVWAGADAPPWSPPPGPPDAERGAGARTAAPPRATAPCLDARDHSESGREWGWVRGALAAGVDPETVYRRLCARAGSRKGAGAAAYARHTVDRALHLMSLSTPQRGAAVVHLPERKS